MGVNFAASVAAIGFLKYFGRRNLLISTMAAATAFLVIMGILVPRNKGLLELIFTIFYIMAFEFGPGPIVWIYMSEVMNEKGVAVGTFLNWLFTLIFAISTTKIYTGLGGLKMFEMFAIFCGTGLLFVFFFIKETKGLSES
jgi:hypothetical protein